MKRLIALLDRAGAGARAGHRARPRQVQRRRSTRGRSRSSAPTATTSPGNFGKAQLVDNKRNDKLSVHIRRVAAKTTYTYKLQEGVCKEGAAGGTDVAGFKYKPLKTNRKGVGNSTARSKTFTAKRDVKYSVVVYGGGEVVLCAQLRTKHWHGKRHGKPDKPHGKSDDKPKGKSDDAPGQAEDKQRGKSDDAPGPGRGQAARQERRRARPGRGQAARQERRRARPREDKRTARASRSSSRRGRAARRPGAAGRCGSC